MAVILFSECGGENVSPELIHPTQKVIYSPLNSEEVIITCKGFFGKGHNNTQAYLYWIIERPNHNRTFLFPSNETNGQPIQGSSNTNQTYR